MSRIFRLPGAVRKAPEVEAWFQNHRDELGTISFRWFHAMRDCGDDVREILHDGQPTACIGDAAFAYVDSFKAHVNVGFFCGSELPDPAGLLEGAGKFMRHVKLRPGCAIAEAELRKLIQVAYNDMRKRLNTA